MDGRRRNFYSGANRGRISNNCGLEGLNGVIKLEGTRHVRMPILPFIEQMLYLMGNESKTRSPDDVNFKGAGLLEPTLTRSLCETAFHMSTSADHFIKVHTNTYIKKLRTDTICSY